MPTVYDPASHRNHRKPRQLPKNKTADYGQKPTDKRRTRKQMGR